MQGVRQYLLLVLVFLTASVAQPGCSKPQNRAFRAATGLAWVNVPLAEAPLEEDAAPAAAEALPEAAAVEQPAEAVAKEPTRAEPQTKEEAPEELPAPPKTEEKASTALLKHKDPAQLTPQEVEVWSALLYPDDLALQTTVPLTLRTKGFEETFYDHPFLKKGTSVAGVFKRVIANDHKRQNFDMRDGLILPMPSTLTVTLPGVADASLVYSYCVLDGAFSGDREKEATLAWNALLDGKQVPLEGGSSKLNLTTDPKCTQWVEARIPLPVPTQTTRKVQLALTPKSGKKSQTAVVIANLSLVVAVRDSSELPHLGHKVGPTTAPNIVVIFLDAARGDCVGPANTSFPSVTPTIDELAKEGVTFTQSFSVSNQTRPSITGFLQSQHPTVGSFHSRSWNFKDQAIAEYYKTDPPLFPRLLEQAGFLTASIGRNHFQYGVTKMALDPGFELIWDNRFGQTDTVHIINRSIQFLKDNRERKFFLQINISPTHQPYNPPEKYKTWAFNRLKSTPNPPARKDYLAELYYADQEVGRFLKVLRELGLDKRTIVVITADHGETMHNSHSCYSEVFKTICHTSHGLTLYDEEIHVPLIFWAPFLEGFKHQVRHNVVSALDVIPTLLNLVGLPTWERHMGRSLLEDLMGAEKPDEEIYVESRLSSGVRIGGWKYIFHHKKDDARTAAWKSGGDGDQELYDLKADPNETRNLIGSKTKVAAQLREALKRLRTGFQEREQAARGSTWSPTGTASGKAEAGNEAGTPGEAAAPAEAPASKEAPAANEDEPEQAEPPESEPTPAHPGAGALDTPPPSAQQTPDMEPSQPEKKVRSASNGFLYVALNADKQKRAFQGLIRTEGRFVKLEAFRENRCIERADSRTIKIRCDLEADVFKARVAVEPPGSPVQFDLFMGDEAPVDASRFYVGRFGVALFPQPALREDRDFRLARSTTSPNFQPGFDAGVFVWHDMTLAAASTTSGPTGAPEDEPFDGQETIQDEATRNVLKELGYWK